MPLRHLIPSILLLLFHQRHHFNRIHYLFASILLGYSGDYLNLNLNATNLLGGRDFYAKVSMWSVPHLLYCFNALRGRPHISLLLIIICFYQCKVRDKPDEGSSKKNRSHRNSRRFVNTGKRGRCSPEQHGKHT